MVDRKVEARGLHPWAQGVAPGAGDDVPVSRVLLSEWAMEKGRLVLENAKLRAALADIEVQSTDERSRIRATKALEEAPQR